ncbi:MAG: O-antigen ligase family protein [Pirellulaceae bacterium]|nr:O-antigen ligase family protein [Pirellulaceae bacterium]
MPVEKTSNERLGRAMTESEQPEGRLTLFERALLAVAVWEIPFGIDKYYEYAESHGNLGAVAGYSVSLASICVAALYVFWFMGFVRRRMQPQKTLWGIPQLMYLSAVALSILAAEVRHLALCDLFLLLQAYAIFFYVANRIRHMHDLMFLVACLAVGLGLQGLIMILQKAMGPGLYGEVIQISMIKFIVWPDGRTAGTLHSAVLAGSWLAILWLVVLPVFMTQRDNWLQWGLGVCLTLGLFGMLFTQTRGAVFTVVFGAILLGGLMLTRGWLPTWFIRLAAVGAILTLIPLAQILQNRVLQGDEGSAESRVHLTAIALETIPKSPIFGHGAGNCHVACLPVANSAAFRSEWYFTVHCKYLVVWIETGIIGLIAFGLVLFNGVRQGVVAWSRQHRILSPLGMGCAAAIVGHSLHMFVDIFNSRPQVQTLWLVLGVVALTYRLAITAAPTSVPSRGELSSPTGRSQPNDRARLAMGRLRRSGSEPLR